MESWAFILLCLEDINMQLLFSVLMFFLFRSDCFTCMYIDLIVPVSPSCGPQKLLKTQLHKMLSWGCFARQKQWERWRAKRKLISGSMHYRDASAGVRRCHSPEKKIEIVYAQSCNSVHFRPENGGNAIRTCSPSKWPHASTPGSVHRATPCSGSRRSGLCTIVSHSSCRSEIGLYRTAAAMV